MELLIEFVSACRLKTCVSRNYKLSDFLKPSWRWVYNETSQYTPGHPRSFEDKKRTKDHQVRGMNINSIISCTRVTFINRFPS